MNKILLSTEDIEHILKWRDNHQDLVRHNLYFPFEAIKIICKDNGLTITVINKNNNIEMTITINSHNIGKLYFTILSNGFFDLKKQKGNMSVENIQDIVTCYASLMAYILYNKDTVAESNPQPKTESNNKKSKTTSKKKHKNNTITYILNRSYNNINTHKHHKSPEGIFSVRGHYRKYKNGKTVWIKEYKKGEGKQKNKIYKL